MTDLGWLFVYGLIALVIFLLLELKDQKKKRYQQGYWDGVTDYSESITYLLKDLTEEEFDETTETEQ